MKYVWNAHEPEVPDKPRTRHLEPPLNQAPVLLMGGHECVSTGALDDLPGRAVVVYVAMGKYHHANMRKRQPELPERPFKHARGFAGAGVDQHGALAREQVGVYRTGFIVEQGKNDSINMGMYFLISGKWMMFHIPSILTRTIQSTLPLFPVVWIKIFVDVYDLTGGISHGVGLTRKILFRLQYYPKFGKFIQYDKNIIQGYLKSNEYPDRRLNMKLLNILAGALIGLGAMTLPASAVNVDIIIAPPAPHVEVVPPPRHGYIWAPGYWQWNGRHHVWIRGRWLRARPGYVWAHERWEKRHGRYYFVPGRWDRRHEYRGEGPYRRGHR